LITPAELPCSQQSASDGEEAITFLLLCWAQELATETYQERSIVSDRAVELLVAETLINLVGEGEDDLGIEEYVERTVQMTGRQANVGFESLFTIPFITVRSSTQLTRFWNRAYKGAMRPVVSDVNCWDAEDINPFDWMPMVGVSGTRQHSICSVSEGPFPGSITEVNFTEFCEVSTFVH
uniref:Dynein_AAA_lid domain-containing protein n=1 Tax=Taenia asiatica TaxID=60517 RepID=A0A0R3VWZ2_TAEAS